jgi:septum formation protein
MGALWNSPEPLVLASRSAARKALLEAAGIPVEVRPADVDERAVERAETGAGAAAIAVRLAESKALKCSADVPNRLVLAADQVLSFDGAVLHKPETREILERRLLAMSGRAHSLHSAGAFARAGAVLFSCCEEARLTFRTLSPTFVERYVRSGDDISSCAGGYLLERSGIQLMERVEGNYWTVLGLPLMPILEHLRRLGCLEN